MQRIRIASESVESECKFLNCNLPGLADFQTSENRKQITENRAYRKKTKKNRAGKGLASTKSDLSFTDRILGLIVKLKKLEHLIRVESSKELIIGSDDKMTKHICVLEKLPNALKVKQEEDGQLWDGQLWDRLESELSLIMSLCDAAYKEFQHLHDADKNEELYYFEGQRSLSFFGGNMLNRRMGADSRVDGLVTALHKLYDLIPRLVFPGTTFGNSDMGLRKLGIEIERAHYDQNRVPNLTFKGKSVSALVEDREVNMIDIKSRDMFLKHLGIARISHTPVVILFYSKDIKRCKEFLPHFDDLRNQYLEFCGDPIKFFRVDVENAFKVFKIKSSPTVVVMEMRLGCLRESGRLSIDETIIVPAFVRELKKLLDECFLVNSRQYDSTDEET